MLEQFFSSCLRDAKSKEPLREWHSPKKTCDVTVEDCKENIVKFEDSEDTNYKPSNEMKSPTKTLILQYGRVKNDFICNFNHKHVDGKFNANSIRTAIDFAMDAYEINGIKDNLVLDRKRRMIEECGVGERWMTDVKRRRIDEEKRQETVDGECRKEEIRREIGYDDVKSVTERDDGVENGKIIIDKGTVEERHTERGDDEIIVKDRDNSSVEERQQRGKEKSRIESGQIKKQNDNSEEVRQIINDKEEGSLEKIQNIKRENGSEENGLIRKDREGSAEEKRREITGKDHDVDRKRRIVRDGSRNKKRRVTGRDDYVKEKEIITDDDANGMRMTVEECVDGKIRLTERDGDSEIHMADREDNIVRDKQIIKKEYCMENESKVDVDLETQSMDVIDLSKTTDRVVKRERERIKKRPKNYRLRTRNDVNLENKHVFNNDNETKLDGKNVSKNAYKKGISKKKNIRYKKQSNIVNATEIVSHNKNVEFNNKLDFKRNNKDYKNINDELHFDNNDKISIKENKNEIRFNDKISTGQDKNEISFKHNNNKQIDFKQDAKKRRNKTKKQKSNDLGDDELKKSQMKTKNDVKISKNKSKSRVRVKLQYKKNKKLLIQNKGFNVKIKWRKERLNLKITDERRVKNKMQTPKVLKQYVLNYSPEKFPTELIMKPEGTPIKRKYVKAKIHTDNLIQTNISSFFKTTPRSN